MAIQLSKTASLGTSLGTSSWYQLMVPAHGSLYLLCKVVIMQCNNVDQDLRTQMHTAHNRPR
jgi:hypothetical protein